MKHRLQLSPAFAAATVCALLWFALWLIPFRPIPLRAILSPTRPAAALCPPDAETTRELRSPTLFALPSEEGFSGTFPTSRINLFVPTTGHAVSNPLPEPRINPADSQYTYLPRAPVTRPEPDQISLREALPRLKTDLPAPGARASSALPQPDRIALFLSPELQTRTDSPLQLTVSGELPSSVRIHLSIRPDGTVDQSIFETPVENETLAGAIRQLRFKPASSRTDGWLELRFTPKEDS